MPNDSPFLLLHGTVKNPSNQLLVAISKIGMCKTVTLISYADGTDANTKVIRKTQAEIALCRKSRFVQLCKVALLGDRPKA